ncbi:MAG: S41 family peptidase [Candidatus Shapirobacteria bacterium]
MKRRFKKVLVVVVFGVLMMAGGLVAGKMIFEEKQRPAVVEKNIYLEFINEVRGIISDNYWNKLTVEQLDKLLIAGTEKLTGQIQNGSAEKVILGVLKQYESDEKRKQFTSSLMDAVLASLEPVGRSRLYVKQDAKALSDNVNNKTDKDFYADLGVDKKASDEEIKKAGEIKKDDPLAQKAYQILSDPVAKKNYDIAGVEPTMEYKLMDGGVFYIHLTKFSPQTVEELTRVTEKVKGKMGVVSLILDLRDNVGGAIDGLPYFLGPFIGNDNYAYQYFHQGAKEDFKTKSGWLESLVQYKRVVVLINGNTQSTAELMASVVKKYNVGVVVGTKTRGWGTVERVFPIKNQIDQNEVYSVFLVHSLTLREDGEPIEGKGVEPVVDISSKTWQKELLEYNGDERLVKAVSEVL